MATPWYQYAISQQYGQNGERGVDIATPYHTPVTALYPGSVRFAGRTQWACGSSGGEVTVVCNVPGQGVMTSYYLHLDTVMVAPGDTVRQGQVVGLSGGQLGYGNWPVVNCPQQGDIYSTGPHTEFGFNAPWVSGPGHQIDPTSVILAARTGTLPVSLPDGSTVSTLSATPGGAGGMTLAPLGPSPTEAALLQVAALSNVTYRVITNPYGFDGICQALDYAEQIPPFNAMNLFGSVLIDVVPIMVRLLFLNVGIVIILLALFAGLIDILADTLGGILGRQAFNAVQKGVGTAAGVAAPSPAPAAAARGALAAAPTAAAI